MKFLLLGCALGAFAASDKCTGDKTYDNFPDKSVLDNEMVSIEYKGYYKIITVKGFSTSYGLYCGATEPTDSSVSKWFSVPVTSVGTNQANIVTALEMLGQRDSLEFYSEPTKLASPCISASALDAFQNNQNSVDVYFSGSDSSNNSFPIAVDFSYDPLQATEWMKVISAFFNLEDSANGMFKKIQDQYECNAGNGPKSEEKFAISYIEEKAGTKSLILMHDEYHKKIVENSGASLVGNDGVVRYTNVDDFHAAVEEADFLIDMTVNNTANASLSEILAEYGYTEAMSNYNAPFLQKNQVMAADQLRSSLGVNAFPQVFLNRPDLFLRDIIKAHTPEFDQEYSSMFLRFARNDNFTFLSTLNTDCDTIWATNFDSCPASKKASSDSEKSENGKDDDDDDDEDGDSDNSLGIVFGIIGGFFVIVAATVIATHYYNKKKQRSRIQDNFNSSIASDAFDMSSDGPLTPVDPPQSHF